MLEEIVIKLQIQVFTPLTTTCNAVSYEKLYSQN